VIMDRPNDPAGWAKLYAQQAKRRGAQQARDERAASKKRKAADHRPHPLALRADNAVHERAAAEAIQAKLRAEHARRTSAHPLARLAHIPVPEPQPPKRRRGRPPL
jgi:hypothetical protein